MVIKLERLALQDPRLVRLASVDQIEASHLTLHSLATPAGPRVCTLLSVRLSFATSVKKQAIKKRGNGEGGTSRTSST